MARPPVYDDALRRRLLDVTTDEVARRGIDQVTLRDIAHLANTSTSAIYTLFGGKDALFGAVIADGFASLARTQQDTAAAGLSHLGWAYREWALSHPQLYRLMFGGDGSDSLPEEESGESLPSSLEPLFVAISGRMPGADEEDVATRAIATWAQVHGAVSIELAGIVPDMIPAEAVFDAVIRSIDAAFGHGESALDES